MNQSALRQPGLPPNRISPHNAAVFTHVVAKSREVVTPTTAGVTSLIPRQQTPAPAPAGPPPGGRGGAAGGGGAPGFRNTSYFSALGLPAISVPCGFTSTGLPIGLQMSGAPFAESTVLALAHAYEQGTQWHKRRPKLVTYLEGLRPGKR